MHEALSTGAIHEALVAKELSPGEHLVDAGYTKARHIVEARETRGIRLMGPMRWDPNWQVRTKGACTPDDFTIDWTREEVTCPQGKKSRSWKRYTDKRRGAYYLARFSGADCQQCPVKALCTRDKEDGRVLHLPLKDEYDALQAARAYHASEEGQQMAALRAGIEGTVSQGVRRFGLRKSRYRGEKKTHLQHVASAAAMNLARIGDWLTGTPRAQTRTSMFAKLAA